MCKGRSCLFAILFVFHLLAYIVVFSCVIGGLSLNEDSYKHYMHKMKVSVKVHGKTIKYNIKIFNVHIFLLLMLLLCALA